MSIWKKSVVSVIFAATLIACDDGGNTDEAGSDTDQSGETDVVEDINTSAISTACLRELPVPSVTSGVAARTTLTLNNFAYSFEENRHRFTHDRRFKESNGVGLYIFRGKVCVENAEVCADACVRYRIEPGGSLTQRGHHVATPIDPDRITVQYWGRDDAGNLMTIKQEIQIDGDSAEVTSTSE